MLADGRFEIEKPPKQFNCFGGTGAFPGELYWGADADSASQAA